MRSYASLQLNLWRVKNAAPWQGASSGAFVPLVLRKQAVCEQVPNFVQLAFGWVNWLATSVSAFK
jgi:hypothetical protein